MTKCISLTELIKVWDILHLKNTGDLGFTDLVEAFEKVSGVENDISK
jgi:hypothetical protein